MPTKWLQTIWEWYRNLGAFGVKKLGFAAEKRMERVFAHSISSLVGGSLVLPEGLLQERLYYRFPSHHPWYGATNRATQGPCPSALSESELLLHPTLGALLLLHPVSLRSMTAIPHYLDHDNWQPHPYSALSSIAMLSYDCANPRGRSQISNAIHGTLLSLPLIPWKEPLCCVLILLP